MNSSPSIAYVILKNILAQAVQRAVKSFAAVSFGEFCVQTAAGKGSLAIMKVVIGILSRLHWAAIFIQRFVYYFTVEADTVFIIFGTFL